MSVSDDALDDAQEKATFPANDNVSDDSLAD